MTKGRARQGSTTLGRASTAALAWGLANSGRALVFAGLGACASNRDTPALACPIEPTRAAHACIHAKAGPFAALDGTTHPPPLLTETHTLYTVALAPPAAAGGSGQFRFEAPRPGCWVFFMTAPAQVEVHTYDRQARAPVLVHDISACRDLAMAFALALDPGEGTVLTVRAAAGASLGVLVERVGDAPASAPAPARDASAPGGIARDAPTGLAVPRDDQTGDSGRGPDASAEDSSRPDDLGRALDSVCRSLGPCSRDDECCAYCHDGDHCH